MRPLPVFVLLFLLIPVIEIYFLVKVGESVGAWRTIFLVIFTAVVGVWLLRQQGLATLGRVQKSMMEGKAPATEMLEGVFLLVGGGLLLLPGFFTDTIGFLCLIPFSRQFLARWILRRSSIRKQASVTGGGFADRQSSEDRVIDGEFVRKNDDRLE